MRVQRPFYPGVCHHGEAEERDGDMADIREQRGTARGGVVSTRMGPAQQIPASEPTSVVGQPDEESVHDQPSGQLRLLRCTQPRQIANSKRPGTRREERHRGLVVKAAADQ